MTLIDEFRKQNYIICENDDDSWLTKVRNHLSNWY